MCQQLSAKNISLEIFPEKQAPPDLDEMEADSGISQIDADLKISVLQEHPDTVVDSIVQEASDQDNGNDSLAEEDVEESFAPMEIDDEQGGVSEESSIEFLDVDTKKADSQSAGEKDFPQVTDLAIKEIDGLEKSAEGTDDSVMNGRLESCSKQDGAVEAQEHFLNIEPVGHQPQSMENKETAKIKFASVSDPLLLVLLDNGEALLLECDADTRILYPMETATFVLRHLPRENHLAFITACALYSDSGLWLSEGATSALFPAPLFCIVCRKGGSMEVYDLPQMGCIFSVCNFSLGWSILGIDLRGEGFKQGLHESELEEPLPSVAEVGGAKRYVSTFMSHSCSLRLCGINRYAWKRFCHLTRKIVKI